MWRWEGRQASRVQERCFAFSFRSYVFEKLDAFVIGISYKNLFVAGDGDSVREPKLSGLRSILAYCQKEGSLRVEYLRVVNGGIQGKKTVFRVHGDPFGAAKLPGRISQFAIFPLLTAITVQDLNAAVERIRHVDQA